MLRSVESVESPSILVESNAQRKSPSHVAPCHPAEIGWALYPLLSDDESSGCLRWIQSWDEEVDHWNGPAKQGQCCIENLMKSYDIELRLVLYPIGSMYAIYGNMESHQYTPNVSIYASTMDPMGMENTKPLKMKIRNKDTGVPGGIWCLFRRSILKRCPGPRLKGKISTEHRTNEHTGYYSQILLYIQMPIYILYTYYLLYHQVRYTFPDCSSSNTHQFWS